MRTGELVATVAVAAACGVTPRQVAVPLAAQHDVSAEPFMLAGRVESLLEHTERQAPRVLLVDRWNRRSRVIVVRLQYAGTQMGVGDTIVAWCHAEGADTVADSAVVD